jgi:ferredoxin
MKLRVDITKCQGIGLCEAIAPSLFAIGEDGLSHAIKDDPSPEELDAVREVIANCPAGAISLVD